jgi:sortase A
MTLLQEGAARRTRVRGALRTLSSILIVSGALLLADAALTVLWQEPLSALYASREQGRLEDELADIERAPLAAVDRRAIGRLADPGRRLAFSARALRRRTRPGAPLGRLRMPAIGTSDVFVEGTGSSDLRKGPGHYPATPLPGQRGTVAIAGHRTTYGAPFHDLDDLEEGDEIEVEMPYGRFSYRVERTRIVDDEDVSVLRRVGYDRLVLTACHPLYSAAERVVAFARFVRRERSRVTARR